MDINEAQNTRQSGCIDADAFLQKSVYTMSQILEQDVLWCETTSGKPNAGSIRTNTGPIQISPRTFVFSANGVAYETSSNALNVTTGDQARPICGTCLENLADIRVPDVKIDHECLVSLVENGRVTLREALQESNLFVDSMRLDKWMKSCSSTITTTEQDELVRHTLGLPVFNGRVIDLCTSCMQNTCTEVLDGDLGEIFNNARHRVEPSQKATDKVSIPIDVVQRAIQSVYENSSIDMLTDIHGARRRMDNFKQALYLFHDKRANGRIDQTGLVNTEGTAALIALTAEFIDTLSVPEMINEVIKFGNPSVLFGRVCDETLLKSMRSKFVDPHSMYAFCRVSPLLSSNSTLIFPRVTYASKLDGGRLMLQSDFILQQTMLMARRTPSYSEMTDMLFAIVSALNTSICGPIVDTNREVRRIGECIQSEYERQQTGETNEDETSTVRCLRVFSRCIKFFKDAVCNKCGGLKSGSDWTCNDADCDENAPCDNEIAMFVGRLTVAFGIWLNLVLCSMNNNRYKNMLYLQACRKTGISHDMRLVIVEIYTKGPQFSEGATSTGKAHKGATSARNCLRLITQNLSMAVQNLHTHGKLDNINQPLQDTMLLLTVLLQMMYGKNKASKQSVKPIPPQWHSHPGVYRSLVEPAILPPPKNTPPMKNLLPFVAAFMNAVICAIDHYATGRLDDMAMYVQIAFEDLPLPNKYCDDAIGRHDWRCRYIDPALAEALTAARALPISHNVVSDTMGVYNASKVPKGFTLPAMRIEILRSLTKLLLSGSPNEYPCSHVFTASNAYSSLKLIKVHEVRPSRQRRRRIRGHRRSDDTNAQSGIAGASIQSGISDDGPELRPSRSRRKRTRAYRNNDDINVRYAHSRATDSPIQSDSSSDEDGSPIQSDSSSDEDGSPIQSDSSSDEDGSPIQSDSSSDYDESPINSDSSSDEDDML
jgi:hypothetical protein